MFCLVFVLWTVAFDSIRDNTHTGPDEQAIPEKLPSWIAQVLFWSCLCGCVLLEMAAPHILSCGRWFAREIRPESLIDITHPRWPLRVMFAISILGMMQLTCGVPSLRFLSRHPVVEPSRKHLQLMYEIEEYGGSLATHSVRKSYIIGENENTRAGKMYRECLHSCVEIASAQNSTEPDLKQVMSFYECVGTCAGRLPSATKEGTTTTTTFGS
mmetsp:Transcript_55010/g.103059  ORF Transcript_55010/g.103059 Transcript_55010/m.103059 type:complete len:213 (+) Transcript_55010:64-702(+)